MINDRAVEAMRPALEQLLSPGDLDRARAVDAALQPDGAVYEDAVARAIPWQQVSWYFQTPVVGGNVGAEFPLPQGATIRMVVIRAKTPPSGGQFGITIGTDGSPIVVALQSGELSSFSSISQRVTPGAVLRLNITNVSSAAGATVTVLYGGA